MATTIRPLHDRVIIKRLDEEEQIRGGIIIPDTAKEKPQQGEVIAAGEGKFREDGTRQPLDVKPGDRVLFGKYSGSEVKIDALEEPLRQIVNNAGHEGSIVVEKVRADKNVNFGFNAATDEYGDLVKQGVIDPTKVTRTALQNAASIASLLLTTEAVIAELPEDKKKGAPPMPGGDMDY